jgi:hypothetical protein
MHDSICPCPNFNDLENNLIGLYELFEIQYLADNWQSLEFTALPYDVAEILRTYLDPNETFRVLQIHAQQLMHRGRCDFANAVNGGHCNIFWLPQITLKVIECSASRKMSFSELVAKNVFTNCFWCFVIKFWMRRLWWKGLQPKPEVTDILRTRESSLSVQERRFLDQYDYYHDAALWEFSPQQSTHVSVFDRQNVTSQLPPLDEFVKSLRPDQQ